MTAVAAPLCRFRVRWSPGGCIDTVRWDLVAIPSPKGYARIASVCAEHLAPRLEGFYEACDTTRFPDEDFVQVRPYDPALRELDDDE